MTAGALDRRVQFQRAGLVDDGFSEIPAFASHGAPVWAAKQDISDGERFRGGETVAMITTRFRIRSSAFARGLTTKDRLVCDAVTYDIVGIKEIGRLDHLEITAAARLT